MPQLFYPYPVIFLEAFTHNILHDRFLNSLTILQMGLLDYIMEKEIGEIAERFLASEEEETKRLAKRLKKYRDQLFTFVRSPG